MPGGEVVPAASEADGVVTNGMSRFARDGRNANSALLVSVRPEDFGGTEPLAGLDFQRRWERAAFALGGGGHAAPVQRLGDFLAGRASERLGGVLPTYRPGCRPGDLARCLPEFAVQALRAALPALERKLRGFAHPDALLTGVETRSSSPVRVLRDEDGQSSLSGLYPAGEARGARADGRRRRAHPPLRAAVSPVAVDGPARLRIARIVSTSARAASRRTLRRVAPAASGAALAAQCASLARRDPPS